MRKLSVLLFVPGIAFAGFNVSPVVNTSAGQASTLAQSAADAEPELLQLTDTRVTNNWQYRHASYLFNINIPANSTAPLQAITFSQIEGADYPSYSARKSYVFEGCDRNQKISSATVVDDFNNRTVTVSFDPVLQPGRNITVVLRSFRNPRDGIYIYQVAGIPTGQNSRPRRLGTARLSFYEGSFRRGFYR